MRLLIPLLALCGCDPQLAMGSDRPSTRISVEGCNQAVAKLKQCCPAYDSYISCSYSSSAMLEITDLSASQSNCLLGKSCEEIEKAVTRERSICGASFRSKHCR